MMLPVRRWALVWACGFAFLAAPALAQRNAQPQSPLVITIDGKQKAQAIDNFGAAGCWFAEGIGKHWPQEKKERIAELLFSKATDELGNPKGIGLSAWRFNIGAGTAEQGDSSGILKFTHRVECFQNPDGTYDWTKQAGYRWFLEKAKTHGVEKLIAFSNSPPVHMNQNGLGFKTAKDYKSNLKPDQYAAYADFLTEVIRHFDATGLPFDYISPINEPQWDWTGKFGEAKQEGTPWTNQEMYNAIVQLDQSLEQKKLRSQILVPEAATLTHLYGGSGGAARQVPVFFSDTSKLYLGNLRYVPRLVVGHSYFTDTGDSTTVAVREKVAQAVEEQDIAFWQSEYSMLGDGFREGIRGRRSAMDCGLFLAKLIHQDLTVGNASAWQFWNAFEPGSAAFDTRYYLIALQPNATHTDGEFSDTKNLWALGHYSYFIRPGMHRLHTERSDRQNAVEAAQGVMVSAYADEKGKKVLVAINYQQQEQHLQLKFKNAGKAKNYRSYVTTAAEEDNLRPLPVQKVRKGVSLPGRSVTTIVLE